MTSQQFTYAVTVPAYRVLPSQLPGAIQKGFRFRGRTAALEISRYQCFTRTDSSLRVGTGEIDAANGAINGM